MKVRIRILETLSAYFVEIVNGDRSMSLRRYNRANWKDAIRFAAAVADVLGCEWTLPEKV